MRFSLKTFSIDYYVKRKVNYHRLLSYLRTTSSCRDMAREFGVSVDTIINRTERLCRSMIQAHIQLIRDHLLSEALTADGFESFIVSQYFPNNINLLAGKDSQMVYGCTYAGIRRKGRMTERQKVKRGELERRYRPDPKGIEHAFALLAADAAPLIMRSAPVPVLLYTDEKLEYVRALRSLPVGRMVHHIRIPSKQRRTVCNPLFSVNYLDRQIRKDQANHVRETVCFARNVNNAMARLVVYFMHHNDLKCYRERERTTMMRTHAEVAGISSEKIARTFRYVFTRRAFFMRSTVDGFLREVWLKTLETPLKTSREYLPTYAYV